MIFFGVWRPCRQEARFDLAHKSLLPRNFQTKCITRMQRSLASTAIELRGSPPGKLAALQLLRDEAFFFELAFKHHNIYLSLLHPLPFQFPFQFPSHSPFPLFLPSPSPTHSPLSAPHTPRTDVSLLLKVLLLHHCARSGCGFIRRRPGTRNEDTAAANQKRLGMVGSLGEGWVPKGGCQGVGTEWAWGGAGKRWVDEGGCSSGRTLSATAVALAANRQSYKCP